MEAEPDQKGLPPIGWLGIFLKHRSDMAADGSFAETGGGVAGVGQMRLMGPIGRSGGRMRTGGGAVFFFLDCILFTSGWLRQIYKSSGFFD